MFQKLKALTQPQLLNAILTIGGILLEGQKATTDEGRAQAATKIIKIVWEFLIPGDK